MPERPCYVFIKEERGAVVVDRNNYGRVVARVAQEGDRRIFWVPDPEALKPLDSLRPITQSTPDFIIEQANKGKKGT